MEAILLGQAIIADKDLYDMRHFYFDNERVGHSTCGMAFQTLMDTYREHEASIRNIGAWYGAISNSPNRTVLEYLAVHILLNSIRRDGLGRADQELEHPLEKEIFDTVPDVERLITEGIHTCRLYVPATFGFPNIHAAIVRLDRNAKKAYVYLILVTVSRDHKSSEAGFYETQWENWKSSFPRNYETTSTFVCIHHVGGV
jgi:hypothetical protein